MALPVRDQLKYWGIVVALAAVLLWSIGNVLLPFVIGGALAYCLDPIADRLEALGLNRLTSVVVITLVAALIFVFAMLLLLPLLINQATALFNAAPNLVHSFQATLAERFPTTAAEDSILRKSLAQLGTTLQQAGGDLLNTALSSALSIFNVLVLIVLVPVVTFYLLLDWDRMVARIDDMLPRDHAPMIRKIAHDIDAVLASFIRGQGTVCLILGTYYAVGLMLTGLNFGLVVGFVAGLISFIPYVGALVGGVTAMALAFFQFWGDWWMIGAVGAIFAFGQFFEGNILSPNLVGSSVGLHPVWLIFALSLFGTLFGFVGLLLAVPMAASIGVVARFLAAEYRGGRLYLGTAHPDARRKDD